MCVSRGGVFVCVCVMLMSTCAYSHMHVRTCIRVYIRVYACTCITMCYYYVCAEQDDLRFLYFIGDN